MKSEGFLNKWGMIGVVVLVLVALGIMLGIIGIRGEQLKAKDVKIIMLRELLDEIKLSHEIEMTVIRKEKKDAVEKSQIEIEGMPDNAVVIKFMSDEDFFSRADFIGEGSDLVRAVIIDQLRFFESMGVHLVTLDGGGLRSGIQSGDPPMEAAP